MTDWLCEKYELWVITVHHTISHHLNQSTLSSLNLKQLKANQSVNTDMISGLKFSSKSN